MNAGIREIGICSEALANDFQQIDRLGLCPLCLLHPSPATALDVLDLP